MAKIRCHQLFPLGINYLIAARLGKQPLASRLRIALRENLVEALQTIGNQWRDAGQPDSFFRLLLQCAAESQFGLLHLRQQLIPV